MDFRIINILVFATWSSLTLSLSTSENNTRNDSNSSVDDIKITLMNVENLRNATITNKINIRVKKQSTGGAGKYAEASKMPQIKLLRIYLQLFRNLWDKSYIGGAHPLHPNVPKAIVDLYKTRIVEFFFPDIGDDKKTAGM